jgi:hypothetical protein
MEDRSGHCKINPKVAQVELNCYRRFQQLKTAFLRAQLR